LKKNPPSIRSQANKVLSENFKRIFDDEKERPLALLRYFKEKAYQQDTID